MIIIVLCYYLVISRILSVFRFIVYNINMLQYNIEYFLLLSNCNLIKYYINICNCINNLKKHLYFINIFDII